MTVYLCTCGTSAAKKIYANERFNQDWVDAKGGIQPAALIIYDSFKDYQMSDTDALSRHLSAEIHSLARMGVSECDRVLLFSSATPDGQACAQAVAAYLIAKLPGIACEVKIIEGLQVRDAKAFRTQGVMNFTQAVLTEIENYGAAQCVLNPTGGFKSLVPYTVLIGMIKGVEAKYIFEQSTTLIPLPVMPVEFARERLTPILPLLERIQRDSYIPKGEFEAAVRHEDRGWLQSLFEPEGDELTLSPVGLLLCEELERPTAYVPYLSRPAMDDLLKIRQIKETKPIDYLQRVARSAEQLAVGRHANWAGDLFWLKPGGHTRDRYLVSIEGWRLLVWRITDHYGEYEDRLNDTATGKRIQDERRARYEPFVRMDLYEAE